MGTQRGPPILPPRSPVEPFHKDGKAQVPEMPDLADPSILYDALDEYVLKEHVQQRAALKRRRRVNCVPVILGIFLPWLVFLGAFGTTGFLLHYLNPVLTGAMVLVALALSGHSLVRAWKMWRSGTDPDTFYPIFFAISCTVALVWGICAGDYTFWHFMQPCYDVEILATYSNVNPSVERLWSGESVPTRGRRFQDAGKVYFNHAAVIDGTRAMSFKSGDLYCVAPIVDPSCQGECGYDFWAVGLNCCSEEVADFRCGEHANIHAKSGLRMMHDHLRGLFRLAVVQAESVHGLVSTHPEFFYWVQDPVAEIRHMKLQGYKRYLVWMFVTFFVNAVALGLSLMQMRKRFRELDPLGRSLADASGTYAAVERWM